MSWIIVLLGIMANTAASVLVKLASTPPRQFPSFSDGLNLINLLKNWPFWLGLLCYGVAFFLYALALKHLPISVVHPILTAGAIACVFISSIYLFKEPVSLTKLLGLVCIITGIILLTRRVSI